MTTTITLSSLNVIIHVTFCHNFFSKTWINGKRMEFYSRFTLANEAITDE